MPENEELEPVVDLSPGHVLRLTPAELAKIDQALFKTDGNRPLAAKLLGVPYIQLSHAITRHQVLRSTWLRKDDNYVEAVESDSPRLTDRNPPGEVKTSDEIRATALTKIENKVVAVGPEKSLSRSLSKLGFKNAEIEKLTTVEEFAGQHFTKTLSLMHGGMIKGAMRLMLLAERIEADYLTASDLPESERNWWWDTYFRILDSLRMMNDQSNKAALTRAMINNQKGRGGPGKPGFTPTTAIQINARNVEVTGSGQQPPA